MCDIKRKLTYKYFLQRISFIHRIKRAKSRIHLFGAKPEYTKKRYEEGAKIAAKRVRMWKGTNYRFYLNKNYPRDTYVWLHNLLRCLMEELSWFLQAKHYLRCQFSTSQFFLSHVFYKEFFYFRCNPEEKKYTMNSIQVCIFFLREFITEFLEQYQ